MLPVSRSSVPVTFFMVLAQSWAFVLPSYSKTLTFVIFSIPATSLAEADVLVLTEADSEEEADAIRLSEADTLPDWL